MHTSVSAITFEFPWRPLVSIQRCGLILTLCLVAVLSRPTSSVNAGEDWQPISPDDLKTTSEPKAPGAPAIYLYRQVDRNDSGKAGSEFNYVRIKILTEEGRKYGNVEIPFAKGRYDVAGIRARTIRPDGSIVNFDGKIYENTIVKSKTNKYLAKTFTMPEASVGSIVEYHYTLNFEDNFVFDSHWILSEELFTRHAQFTMRPYARDTWRVRWNAPAGLPAGTQQAKEGPDHIIRMTSDSIPAFLTEDFMPPENELKLRVDFIYTDEIQEMDMNKFWANFGKKQNDRAEGFVGKRKAMEQAVAQVVSQSDTPEVKLRKIYARTQQLRNLSYQTALTEQEEKRDKIKIPSNVEEVLKEGYGYDWQIAWTFLALARAAGFDAVPCLVASRNQYFFTKERLNSSELNSSVVLVQLAGHGVYLNPGAAFTPYGLLPWAQTSVQGLKLDKDGGKWILTTIPESDASRIERKAQMKLAEDGTLEGTVKLTFTGLVAQSRRLEERNEDATERKKYLEDELKEAIPSGSEVELKSSPDWTGIETPLEAEFEVKVPGWLSAAGRKALLPAGLFSAPEKHMFEHAERVYPVYFRYSFKKIDDVQIELPTGWKVADLPKPFDRDAKAAEFKWSVQSDGNVLKLYREIRSDIVIIPKDLYPVLRGFYQTVRTEDDQQIVLMPAGTSANR
jgi:Domain of Unknown Function with PDB structure (DUF3857)